MKRVIAGLLVACLVGCTTQNQGLFRDDSGALDATWDSGAATGDTGLPVSTAVWFALDGQVELVDGVATELIIETRFLPDDVGDGTLCADAPRVETLTPLDVPDPLVFHWWEVTLDPSEGTCDGRERLPTTLRVGLGELYSGVVAGVDQHGLGDVRDSLYGTYASFEAPVGDGLDATTYAYGYAGTEADRAGETTAADAGPMPDGRYLLTAFYLFELPEG